jgi:hypothetical protein
MVQGMAGTAASTGVLLTQVKLILELLLQLQEGRK